MKHFLSSLLVCTFLLLSCSRPQPSSYAQQTPLLISDSSVLTAPVGYKFSAQESFKVLSWNVEHFVDPFDDPYINNRREDEPAENMKDRVNLLITALHKADADVVVLQEFESEKYLMKLTKDSFPELGYRFFSDAASPDWYMNVVLMSRFPLGVLRAYGDVTTPVPGYLDDEGKKETQSHLNTRMWTLQVFPAADYHFWLTGVHLKAGGGNRNKSMRTGQIQFLQTEFQQLMDANPFANIMMAGDFNAYPNSSELDLLTSPGKDYSLIDVLDSTVLTHPSDQPERRLDYMLLNPNMMKELKSGAIEVKYFFSADSMRMLSDHLPVMGEFYPKDL